MFYVQRDAQGGLLRVEPGHFTEATDSLPTDHHQIQEWFANKKLEGDLDELRHSDMDMVRVLEDLIRLLTLKGVINKTDLPAAAQAKLNNRHVTRAALGGLGQLINDEEAPLI